MTGDSDGSMRKLTDEELERISGGIQVLLPCGHTETVNTDNPYFCNAFGAGQSWD